MGEAVGARARELLDQIPLGVEAGIISLQSQATTVAINAFLVNLIEAVVIVVGVLVLFMGLRSSLIIGFVLALTICGTFIFMGPWDVALERISLGALVIALGMLVDNAIVVVDGIMVRQQKGMRAEDAAVEVVGQTSVPLLGATGGGGDGLRRHRALQRRHRRVLPLSLQGGPDLALPLVGHGGHRHARARGDVPEAAEADGGRGGRSLRWRPLRALSRPAAHLHPQPLGHRRGRAGGLRQRRLRLPLRGQQLLPRLDAPAVHAGHVDAPGLPHPGDRRRGGGGGGVPAGAPGRDPRQLAGGRRRHALPAHLRPGEAQHLLRPVPGGRGGLQAHRGIGGPGGGAPGCGPPRRHELRAALPAGTRGRRAHPGQVHGHGPQRPARGRDPGPRHPEGRRRRQGHPHGLAAAGEGGDAQHRRRGGQHRGHHAAGHRRDAAGAFQGSQVGVYREEDELLPITVRQGEPDRSDVANIQNLPIWSPAAGQYIPLRQVVSDFETKLRRRHHLPHEPQARAHRARRSQEWPARACCWSG